MAERARRHEIAADLTAAAAVTLAPHPGLGLSHNLLPRVTEPHRFGIVLLAANTLLAVTVFAAACAWAS
jgi:hypothetical protein